MPKITFVHDKPLIEDIFQYDVIIVGTGIHNSLGNGFQYDVKINFPHIEETVKKTPYADSRKLGTVTVIKGKPTFCVGFIHQGAYRKDIQPDFLNYDALKNILQLIDENFRNQNIATTLIGSTQYDGNGNKDKIMEIFNSLSNNNHYYIYDYTQRDYREVNNEKWAEITNLVGKIPYQELRTLKNNYIKIRKYGIHGAKNIK